MKYFCTKIQSKKSCKSVFKRVQNVVVCSHVRKISKDYYIFFKEHEDAKKYIHLKKLKTSIIETDRLGNVC